MHNRIRVVLTHFTQELLATTRLHKARTVTVESKSQLCIMHYSSCIAIMHYALFIMHCTALAKAFGQLVQLGFDVAVFTPAAYQRPRLGRPSKEPSSCGRLRT